MTTYVLNVHVC